LKSDLKWVSSLYEVIKENLVHLIDLLDIGRNVNISSFDLVYKFEELFTNNLEIFNFGNNKSNIEETDNKNGDVTLLINKNSELLRELERTQNELNSIKDSNHEYRGLKDEVETLSWKNKILENRLNFIFDIHISDIDKVVENVQNENFDICYCGGKAFSPLKEEVKNKVFSRIPSKIENNHVHEIKETEDNSLKVSQLKKELTDIIELAEKRRVDKLVVGKQILNSNFICGIKAYMNEYHEYIKELEMRIETYNEYLIDIERERVKELERYKLKEMKEKQRLELIINDLNKKIIGLEKQSEKSKLIKQETPTNTDFHTKIDELNQIIKNQAKVIEELSSNTLRSLEDKVLENKKVISYLEKKLYAFKDHELLDPKYLDKEFRHSTHKRIFEKLYRMSENDMETINQLKDMEKYIKAREDKIHHMEKKIKKLSEQLDNEQSSSRALIQEIANTSVAFQKIQAISETQRNDLQTAEENFTKLYRERNDEKISYERKIAELSRDIEFLNGKDNSNLQTIKTLKQQTKHKDYEVNDVNRKIKDMSNLLNKVSEEKDQLKAELNEKNTEIVILYNKIQATEVSISKLSSQISDNLSVIAEKESIIKSIISSSRGHDGSPEDASNIHKEEYFVNKIELKRLRDLLICKVCNVNEKSVVLSTCFHTFCENCVQQKLKSRDRNCLVCMVKINKFDIQKLYLG